MHNSIIKAVKVGEKTLANCLQFTKFAKVFHRQNFLLYSSTYVFTMLSLSCILISDLLVANLFMHSLSGMILLYLVVRFLKQARAWFLRIVSVRMYACVCVCVCVSAPEAINN